MILILLVTYFTLACALAAWLLLPGLRSAVHARLATHWQALGQSGRRTSRRTRQRALEGWHRTSSHTRHLKATFLRHRWLLGGSLAMLVAPPLLVLTLRDRPTLEDFDDTVTTDAGGVVAALLQGEQLVAPPALPPELFTTAEVELVRPQLLTADRRWDALDADFRQRLLMVYKTMRDEHGYQMALIEGYRSPQRQDLLAATGPHVTNAKAWQSYHQYGLAADSAFLRDGKLVISEKDPWALKGYELYGVVAQRFGLTWGGRWKLADMGHVELRKPSLPRPNGGP